MTNDLCALFHPRTMIWAENFKLESDEILGLNLIGQTTVNFMKFNIPTRVSERAALRRAGFRLLDNPNLPR